MISYIRTKNEGISQVSPSSGKSEKSLIYAKNANFLARKYAILRKSLITPKSVAIIAKRFINAEKYTFIAKRFDYAELYQLSGYYTLTRQGLKPINLNKKTVEISIFLSLNSKRQMIHTFTPSNQKGCHRASSTFMNFFRNFFTPWQQIIRWKEMYIFKYPCQIIINL